MQRLLGTQMADGRKHVMLVFDDTSKSAHGRTRDGRKAEYYPMQTSRYQRGISEGSLFNISPSSLNSSRNTFKLVLSSLRAIGAQLTIFVSSSQGHRSVCQFQMVNTTHCTSYHLISVQQV